MARELIKQVELVELGCDGKLELISKADNFISPPLPLKTVKPQLILFIIFVLLVDGIYCFLFC